MLAVRRTVAQDIPAIAAIVMSLPEYFTEEVAGQVGRDSASHDAWILTDSDEIAGFTVAQRKSSYLLASFSYAPRLARASMRCRRERLRDLDLT